MVRNIEAGAPSIPIAAGQQVLQRTIPTLERAVDEAIGAKPETIDLVLSQVQIIDSTALNWLLSTLRRLEGLGIALRLVEPSPIMADVLLATRLDARFAVISKGSEQSTGGGGLHGRS